MQTVDAKSMTPRDALVLALTLAVTAPTDEKAQMCVEIAEEIAAGLSEFEVELAKRDALLQIDKIKRDALVQIAEIDG